MSIVEQAEQRARDVKDAGSYRAGKQEAMLQAAKNAGAQEAVQGLAQELVARQQAALQAQYGETSKQAELRNMYIAQDQPAVAYDPRDMQGTMGDAPSQGDIDAETYRQALIEKELAKRANAAAAYRGTK